jgi:hypothetical protein
MTLQRLFIAVLVVLAGNAAFGLPCETEYQSATMALSAAKLPEGTHQKIATKIASAWRMFASGSAQSNKNAAAQLDQAKKLLDGPAVKNVPIELRNDVAAAIDAFSACIASSAVPTAPVTVRVFTGETTAAPGPAAGGGVTIRVDGDEAGKTKPDGTATINIPLGVHKLSAEQLPDSKGSARPTEIVESGNLPVDIVMVSGADLSIPAELQLTELQDGVLSRDFTAATLQFVGDDGKTIRIRRVDTIELRSESELLDVTKMFAVRSDGTIALSSADAFRTEVLDRYDPLRLSVHAFDDKGLPYRNAVQFAVGRYRASAVILAPAGVTINPGSIPVSVTNEKVSLSFWATTAADGKAAFSLLPSGHYLYSCDSVQNNVRYYGRGGFDLDADGKTFNVPLFSIQTPTAAAATAQSAVSARRAAAAEAEKPKQWYYMDKHGRSHPVGEPSGEEQKVIALWLLYTPEGTFVPALYQDLVWPEHLEPLSEAQLLAARKLDDAVGVERDRGVINVRLLDDRGAVVFRTNVTLDLVVSLEGTRTRLPKPLLEVKVPAVNAFKLEVVGWNASQTSTFDLRQLGEDLRLRSGELLNR